MSHFQVALQLFEEVEEVYATLEAVGFLLSMSLESLTRSQVAPSFWKGY